MKKGPALPALIMLLCGACAFAQDTASLAADGAALARQGQYAQAKAKFQQAISADPDNATLHLSLGLTCRKLREWDNAAVSLEKAAELDPKLYQANSALALLYEGMAIWRPIQKPGYIQKARKNWQAVIAAAPASDTETLEMAKRHLDALDKFNHPLPK
ncbi:MAG: tetratricopeptide repeat protein [Elusimicrobia bacterium]|nr:tetratricopeptide repeat protein [Elusimicrobiota bacterium]